MTDTVVGEVHVLTVSAKNSSSSLTGSRLSGVYISSGTFVVSKGTSMYALFNLVKVS